MPASAATSLKNASLEQDSDSNGVPDCWERVGWGSNSFTFSRTSDAFTGSFAERIDMSLLTNGDRKDIVQRTASCLLPVTAGHGYRLSAWYKANVQPYFVAYWLDASLNYVKVEVTNSFPSSSDWNQAVATTQPAPAGAVYVSYGLAIGGVGNLTVDTHGFTDASSPPIPPTVSITSPAANATLNGTATLSANASGGAGIDHVDFMVNGNRVATDRTAPYSVSWDTHAVADGPATVAARAVDAEGTSASSSAPVTIQNAGSPPPPPPPPPPTPDYPKNASLEQDTNSDGIPDCWYRGGYGTNTYSFTRTTDAYTGTYAQKLAITAWTNGDRKLMTDRTTLCMPPVTAGHTYKLTAYYKSNVQPLFVAYWLDASLNTLRTDTSARFATSTSWRQASWTTSAAPSGAKYLSYGLAMSAVGTLTVDEHGFADTAPAPPPPPPPSNTPLLPDLVQQPPLDIGVVQASASYRLGFNSAVENHGDGPLIVKGRRPNTSSPMVADQEVKLSGTSSTQLYQGIGAMQFYAPHNHWHYIGFDHYELRRVSDYSFVAPDQKTGFCLGDRYTPGAGGTRITDPQPPGPYGAVVCEPGNTQALGLTEGISVGFGDEYTPQLEGQYIDITGVAPGDYTVVHRTNSDRALRETSYTNDAASALVRLWPNGYGTSPGVQVLQTCPLSERCPPGASSSRKRARRTPPATHVTTIRRAGPEPTLVGGLPFPEQDPPLLVGRAARFYAKKALRKAGVRHAGRPRCARRSRRVYSCRVRHGKVRISLPRSNRQQWWSYRVKVRGKRASGRVRIRNF